MRKLNRFQKMCLTCPLPDGCVGIGHPDCPARQLKLAEMRAAWRAWQVSMAGLARRNRRAIAAPLFRAALWDAYRGEDSF